MSEDDLPQSPLTAMGVAVTEMHEIYVEMVNAGFTPAQAMQLLCAMLQAMINGPSA